MAVETGCMPALKGMEDDKTLLENYPISKVLY
jgi:hypothetical protein